jgi:hypothetical protein
MTVHFGEDRVLRTPEILNAAVSCNVIARATKYGHYFALLVPKAVIPHHLRGDVLQVRIMRISVPRREYTLYAKHAPGYARAYLDLFNVGASQGEEFRILSVRKFHPSEFVAIYNQDKPKGFENTEMFWNHRGFGIRFGSRIEIPLNEVSIDSHQGQVVLHGKLLRDEKNRIKVAGGLGRPSFRLADLSRVTRFDVEGDMDVIMSYTRWKGDQRPRMRAIIQTQNQLLFVHHRISFGCDEISLRGSIELFQSANLRFRVNETARYKAWRYWGLASNHNERKTHQGDIGEALARVVFEKSGYRIIETHTAKSELFRQKHECRGIGRDILILKDGEFYVVEVKHWIAYAKRAMSAGESQILRFANGSSEREVLERRIGAKIKGGFVAQLKWSYRKKMGVLQYKYLGFDSKWEPQPKKVE